MSLYYLVISWMLRILIEFDRLINDSGSNELRQRYRANYRLFRSMSTWLQGEVSSIEHLEGMDKEKVKALQTAMVTITDRMASEWRGKVEELSGQCVE